MLTSLAIIIASVAGGGTLVTLGGLAFTKWLILHEKELDDEDLKHEIQERDRLQLEAYNEERRKAEQLRKERGDSEYDDVPVINVPNWGTLNTCPMCNKKAYGDRQFYADWFRLQKCEGQKGLNAIHIETGKYKSGGPTLPMTVIARKRPWIYQGCVSCGAEWLNRTSAEALQEQVDNQQVLVDGKPFQNGKKSKSRTA